jgi:hypothetical protein
MANEVGKRTVPYRAVASIGLDHVHLVAVDRVYLVVLDVVDIYCQLTSALDMLQVYMLTYQCSDLDYPSHNLWKHVCQLKESAQVRSSYVPPDQLQ